MAPIAWHRCDVVLTFVPRLTFRYQARSQRQPRTSVGGQEGAPHPRVAGFRCRIGVDPEPPAGLVISAYGGGTHHPRRSTTAREEPES